MHTDYSLERPRDNGVLIYIFSGITFLGLVIKTLSLLCTILSLFLYKAPPPTVQETTIGDVKDINKLQDSSGDDVTLEKNRNISQNEHGQQHSETGNGYNNDSYEAGSEDIESTSL